MIKLTQNILQKSEDYHYKFQIGMYFSNIKRSKRKVLLWSDKIEDFYWNFASKINVSEKEIENSIKQITEFFKKKNRKPVIYVTPFTKPRSLSKLIQRAGFKLQFKESWMFYKEVNLKFTVPKNFTIKKIKTKKEMKIFVDIFNKAYSGADPEDPYGPIPPEYKEALVDSFKKNQKNKFTVHYLGFLKNKPIGVATLIYFGKYAGIYNIGTVLDKRKKGMGSSITLKCVLEAQKNKAKFIFLQTEQKSYNEKFYKKLGFSTKFIGQGFVKDEF
ncbi:MAG TPA: GNAT family N-acetyltransferase [bacterium]|nr:GNAT family N-acetyltransferase [bacterium]